jgi:hypothetical protein
LVHDGPKTTLYIFPWNGTQAVPYFHFQPHYSERST